jgi:predicted RNase H-like nuclease
LIELAAAERRLPYKASKVAKYWPHDQPGARRERLIETWRQIVAMLDERIEGVESLLSLPAINSKGHKMKAFEDMLDAVICAWVGACILEGNAIAYGDAVSAIWVPRLPSA